MSSSTTSSAASTTSTVCTSNLYDIPVRDAVCAMPFGGNHTDIMSGCCKSADVVSYYDNCGVYCLAVDQSVADLTQCLFDGGASYQDVFCSGNTTATATATGTALPTDAQATVVASAGSNPTSDSDSDSSSDSDDAEGSGSAAPSTRPEASITTLGLTIGAMLFSATAFGAFQL